MDENVPMPRRTHDLGSSTTAMATDEDETKGPPGDTRAPMATTQAAIQTARSDDPAERLRQLYRATYALVLAYALRRTSSTADAQDAASETFTVAWRRIDDIPDGDRGLLWLYGTCRRVIANSRRGRGRQRDLVSKLEAQPQTSTDDVQGSVVERQEVVVALGRLRGDDQEILRLVAWEGLTNRQLGDFFGCSEQTAAARLSRARKRLEKAYAEAGQSDLDHHNRGPVR